MSKPMRPITVDQVVAQFDVKGKLLKVMKTMKPAEGWTDDDMRIKCGGIGEERWKGITRGPEFRQFRLLLTNKKTLWGGKAFLAEVRKRIPRQIAMEV